MKKQTKKPKQRRVVYKFNVLNKNHKWESWTGPFKTLKAAKKWFDTHGQFHLDNEHTLGLFKNNKLIKTHQHNEPITITTN